MVVVGLIDIELRARLADRHYRPDRKRKTDCKHAAADPSARNGRRDGFAGYRASRAGVTLATYW
jgi:hypothetical protein